MDLKKHENRKALHKSKASFPIPNDTTLFRPPTSHLDHVKHLSA